MAKRRVFVTQNSVVREVFPRTVIKYTWDNERDQIFKRKKLAVKLLFVNDQSQSITDFSYFSQLELGGNTCAEIRVEIKVKCAGEFINEWDGYFSTGAGRFDFDKCEFEVQPEPEDKYRCMFENWEREFNMFETETISTISTGTGAYVTLVGNTTGLSGCCDNTSPTAFAGNTFSYHNSYASAQDMFDKGWCVKSQELTPVLTSNGSQQTVVEILLDNPADPFVVGNTIRQVTLGTTQGTICYVEWVDLAHTIQRVYVCGVTGSIPVMLVNAQWDNTLSGGTASGLSISGSFGLYVTIKTTWHAWETNVPCVGGVCDPAVPPTWYLISSDCAGSGTCKFRHCAGVNKDINYRGVSYKQMIANRIDELCTPLKLTSIIFDYQPDTADPHYAAGIDYITGTFSRIHHLIISQKSDIINPQASNPATVGNLSLKVLLDWARDVFEIYWDITTDSNGDEVLRLEHFDFYEQQFSRDLRDPQYRKYLNNKNSYEHTKERIPQFEKFKWVEAGGIDFVGKDIIYTLPCATVGDEITHTPKDLTTDMFYLLNNPNASNEGFVMIACDFVMNTLTTNVDTGLLTGQSWMNAYLSWANLHFNYHRYNRFRDVGTMNDVLTNFFSWKPTIRQVVLQIPGCCDLPDPEGYMLTELGEQILDHYRANVDKMELDGKDDMLSLTLSYSI